jgi:hypothetical protein
MIIHDRILRLSDTPTLDERQRRIADWSTMPLLESQIDRHPLAGTTDEDFAFGMGRLISGFEALLREQDAKAGRRASARRVTAARPAARSGERAAPRRASRPGSGAAAKPAVRSAAASKAAPDSQAAGGRTRARRAS